MCCSRVDFHRNLISIVGPGTGSFTLGFGQLHMMVQVALKKKQAVMIGEGSGVSSKAPPYSSIVFETKQLYQIWHRVHILDLSNLYVLLVEAILDQKPNLPTGMTGYYFAENAYQSWKSIAERIGEVGKKIGAFETSDVGKITLASAAEEFYHGDLRHAEGVLASKYVFHSLKLISKQEGSFRLTQPARERKRTERVRF
jgi:hypothetical protein